MDHNDNIKNSYEKRLFDVFDLNKSNSGHVVRMFKENKITPEGMIDYIERYGKRLHDSKHLFDLEGTGPSAELLALYNLSNNIF